MTTVANSDVDFIPLLKWVYANNDNSHGCTFVYEPDLHIQGFSHATLLDACELSLIKVTATYNIGDCDEVYLLAKGAALIGVGVPTSSWQRFVGRLKALGRSLRPLRAR